MRQIIVVLLLIGSLFLFNQCGSKLSGTISMSGAWAIYPMVVKWSEEYQKINPGVKIDIAAGGAGKGMTDVLANVVDIGMVSREISDEEVKNGAWFVAVTKDAVVPTINANNPLIQDILNQGVKKEVLVNIWLKGKIKDWNQIIPGKPKTPIHVYTRSDACGAAQTWAEFLGGTQEDLKGVGVYGDPGVIEAVQKDNTGIGFNNINYVYDAKTKKQFEGVNILPMDLDNNGKLDDNEKFYNTRDEIATAIATGKYPSPPARKLYLVCKGTPDKELVKDFLKWILTEGQKYVPETGYINLSAETLKEELAKIE